MKRIIPGLIVLMMVMVWRTAPALAAGKDEVADGQKLFMQYCASCHGKDGMGDGPVAHSLTKPPANLRMLSDKYGSPLPAAKLAEIIDGRDAVRAHGTPEMPVWGERFYALGQGDRGELGISEIIGKIVAYLDTIQDRRRASR
ncbi:MAG TPA: c-type cytochrome [Candidatus Binataceae bacterium]|nr:c-type cytochrome [Candidatus Binataceae bacterium]